MWIKGQFNDGSDGSWVMGHVGHGSRGSWVTRVIHQFTDGSDGSWVTWVMDLEGHVDQGQFTSGQMGQMSHVGHGPLN